eukprot:415334-Hanusia_phi.AAC.1
MRECNRVGGLRVIAPVMDQIVHEAARPLAQHDLPGDGRDGRPDHLQQAIRLVDRRAGDAGTTAVAVLTHSATRRRVAVGNTPCVSLRADLPRRARQAGPTGRVPVLVGLAGVRCAEALVGGAGGGYSAGRACHTGASGIVLVRRAGARGVTRPTDRARIRRRNRPRRARQALPRGGIPVGVCRAGRLAVADGVGAADGVPGRARLA